MTTTRTKGDQEPSRPKPPGDFQYSCNGVAVGRAGQLQWLVGNNRVVHQQQREQDQEDHPRNSCQMGFCLNSIRLTNAPNAIRTEPPMRGSWPNIATVVIKSDVIAVSTCRL
jgi:hypothetical protein